jgi:hypothetical protein
LEVFLGGVLTELDGTPLVAIEGMDIEAIGLQASRGARPDRAKFEMPGRDRSGARVRISWRSGKLRVVAQINRARVLAPAACLAGADMATLRSSVTLQGQDGESTSYTSTQNWKCSKRRSCDGCYDLKTIRSSNSGHGGHGGHAGNRPPKASVRFENLTRDRTTLNWIRLDASGSEDRDGRVVSYTYEVRERPSGRTLYGPGATSTPVAHVQLAPGDYEVLVRVVDNDGTPSSETRRLSISGAAVPGFGRLGVGWSLEPSWASGDRYSVLRHATGPLDLGAMDAALAEASGSSAQSLERQSMSRQSQQAGYEACGNSAAKAGFWGSIISGTFEMAAGVAAIVAAPEAELATAAATVALVSSAGGTVASAGGTSISNAGGTAITSCLQQEIDDLANSVMLQGQQILQIQNDLGILDSEFYNAWLAILTADEKVVVDNYEATYKAFMATESTASVTIDCADPTQASCTCPTTNGPAEGCAITDGGLVGSFMSAAGLWSTAVGPPVEELCNVPGPLKGATPCSGSNVLQSGQNYGDLYEWVNSNASDFQESLLDLTGTGPLSSCTTEAYKCVALQPGSLLLTSIENLYQNLLNQSQTPGLLRTRLNDNTQAGSEPADLIAYIDGYNQMLTGFFQQARAVLYQAYTMEYLVNNFNFFGNLPAGPIANGLVSATETPIQKMGLFPAAYFGGPDGIKGYQCSNTPQQAQYCLPGDSGYACGPSAPDNTAGSVCTPGVQSACGNQPGKCKYQYCKGHAKSCQVDTQNMEAPYNAAQEELFKVYAARFNLLYELYLQYLVTDLPVAASGQSWPLYEGPDSFCDQGGNCVNPQIDFEKLVTTAAYQQPGYTTPRESQLIGQPIGWVQIANANFDSSPYDGSTEDPYQPSSTAIECAADYGSVTTDQVSNGQPGFVSDESYICPTEYPYCVGYMFGKKWGTCSSVAPWTASGVVYQYGVKDVYQCMASVRAYNSSTTDSPPNIRGAIPSNKECPSVFETPGGQMPRYGYFDGWTLQPYTFEAAGTTAQWQESSQCPDWDLCRQSTNPGLNSLSIDSPEQYSDLINTFPCTKYTPEAAGKITFIDADSSSTCSPILGLLESSEGELVCPGFVATSSTDYPDNSFCVDTSWAQNERTTVLANCQACLDEGSAEKTNPKLLLAGAMQGNLGACVGSLMQIGTVLGSAPGEPASGPKMGWYTPSGYDVSGADNRAMLCQGCVYLGCGNYPPLDSGTLPFGTDANPWGGANFQTTPASQFYLNISGGNDASPESSCSNDKVGWPCTVAGVPVRTEYHKKDYCQNSNDSAQDGADGYMATIMVNDYRCGYLPGGSAASYVGMTNDDGRLSIGTNSAAGGATYPWGCGAFGFTNQNSLSQNGDTSFVNLVFGQPNATTGLWDAVVTSDKQHFAYDTGFQWSGQQVGVQLVAQCTNGGVSGCGIGKSSDGACISIVTPSTATSMKSLGYSCQLNCSEEFCDTSAADGSGQSMTCTMNDGRVYSLGAPYDGGGFALPTKAESGVGDVRSDSNVGLDFRLMNGACSSECFGANPPGYTSGAMYVNTGDGSCPGFMSPSKYCGGHCYNQPAIGNSTSVANPIPVKAPIDCRACVPQSEPIGSCPSDFVPYDGGGIEGGYCCESYEIEYPYHMSSGYSSLVMDHCSTYVECTNPPCGAVQPPGWVGGPLRTMAAVGDDSCYPWGNTSMWPTYPFSSAAYP